MPRVSDVKRAKTFLAEEFPFTATPDRVKELLGLSTSAGTLGRKFRDAARTTDKHGKPRIPELLRTYYRNDRNEEIAQYAYNPEYHQQQVEAEEASRQADRADFLHDQARDEAMMNGGNPA